MRVDYLSIGLAALLALVGCSDDDGGQLTSMSTSSSSSATGGGGTGGSGAAGGAGGDGGMGGQPIDTDAEYGCPDGPTEDLTDMDIYNILWENPHGPRCLRFRTGTTIGWSGIFVNHPLAGGQIGEPLGTKDEMSPITLTDQSGVSAIHVFNEVGPNVNEDGLGVYPYYCESHTQEMRGVVYIEEAGTGGQGGGD